MTAPQHKATKQRSTTARPKYARVKHAFLYKLFKGDGSYTVHKAWARVIHATRGVELELTADHVRRSMELRGVGDTSRCSMAICTYDHAEKFSHRVEGHVDWSYSRAWV